MFQFCILAPIAEFGGAHTNARERKMHCSR